ncbi:MAG: SurA N-terminal domain-containing protein, partial [Candidatus Omnitrophica bacterium]|nr:SurA N-terminal domain-containing protein [Candidatus Omnitrophota bacterium]
MVLKRLRKKKTAKRIWIVLIIIILPAFVFWGLGSASKAKRRQNYAGELFGKKVSLQEFIDAYHAVITQGIMRWGEENFEKIAKSTDLRQEAWNRLILLRAAQSKRIQAGDKELAAYIQNEPLFQYKGKFNPKTYKEILQYVLHVPVNVFEEQMRKSLMIVKLYEDVADQIKLSEEEIKEAYRLTNEKIAIDYIAALYAQLSKEIQVTDSEIQDYYHRNEKELKKTYIDLDYLKIALP